MAHAIILSFIAALLCACHDAREDPASDDSAAPIPAHENRSIHTELTPAILASIPDADVEQAVIDYVDSRIGDDDEHAPQIVGKLPVGARALYITWWVEAEVENGGFNQYYWNDTGRFADQAPEAFEFFSAHEHAALMREANSVRAMDAAKMQKYRDRGTMQAFSDSYEESQLGPLDEKFYALREDLSALRITKIRSMPEFFCDR